MDKVFVAAFFDELEKLQKVALSWRALKWGTLLGVPAVGLAGAHAVSKGAAKGRREAELARGLHYRPSY